MILKAKDSQQAHIEALKNSIATSKSVLERRQLEKELAFLRAGENGEKEAAYYIDFHLKNSRNWMVIHDLRLEWEGRVAQIDHLIINRMLEAYVVESKNLKTKVRYQNGGWERMNGNDWEGFPCPVEQNRRHIMVLKGIIEAQHLTPTRLGLSLPVSYLNVVAVNPACSVVGSFPKDAKVWKMDGLPRELCEDIGNPLSLLSVVASETLEAFAKKLTACHRPAPARRKEAAVALRDQLSLGLKPAAPRDLGLGCAGCGGQVTKAEAKFCRKYGARFAGKTLCRRCQKFAPPGGPESGAQEGVAARCAECGAGVERKVVSFCRIKSWQFEGRILCRDCQQSAKLCTR